MNMNVDLDDFIPTDEQAEVRAMSRALALIEVVADPAGAADRLKKLKAATVDLGAQRSAAEQVLAEATSRTTALAEGEKSLAKRTEEFQTWVDGTEKGYREREGRIRTNEEDQAAREAKLVQGETDLARRVSAHEARVKSLKETLA
jgi:hypothetical protein